MTISPSASELLADLAGHGIELQPHGDAIRFRPRHAMTPTLLQRLQAHKTELLATVIVKQVRDRGEADLAEALVEAWEERISIITADNIPLAEAERTALEQLRAMLGKQ